MSDHRSAGSLEETSWSAGIIRELALAVALIAIGVAFRILCSDLPNFAPVAALGLFAGFCISRKVIAFLVPLGIMVASNYWFGGYSYTILFSVLACYAVMPFAGSFLRTRFDKRSQRTAISCRWQIYATALAGSILFFVVTNFAVWGVWSANQQSIWECYAAAIPFFRFTLISDLVFAFALFATYDIVMIVIASRSVARQRAIAEAG